MIDNIKVITHSSIKIDGEKNIYIDPFKIDKKFNDADYVFITHNHQTVDKVKFVQQSFLFLENVLKYIYP